MPGSAGSKYGIVGDGVPVAKGKVMEKLEPLSYSNFTSASLHRDVRACFERNR